MMNLLIKFGIFSEHLARFYIAEMVIAIESVHAVSGREEERGRWGDEREERVQVWNILGEHLARFYIAEILIAIENVQWEERRGEKNSGE